MSTCGRLDHRACQLRLGVPYGDRTERHGAVDKSLPVSRDEATPGGALEMCGSCVVFFAVERFGTLASRRGASGQQGRCTRCPGCVGLVRIYRRISQFLIGRDLIRLTDARCVVAAVARLEETGEDHQRKRRCGSPRFKYGTRELPDAQSTRSMSMSLSGSCLSPRRYTNSPAPPESTS